MELGFSKDDHYGGVDDGGGELGNDSSALMVMMVMA